MAADHYKAAVDIVGETEEKPHFCFANFMDQLMIDARRRQSSAQATEKNLDRMSGKAKIDVGRDKPYMEWLPQVLTTYANSIKRGHRHIYKSLPRLLTLWYDFGTQAVGKSDKKMQAVNEEVQATMLKLSKWLPRYVWLVSLPQLCSRITHQHPETNHLTSNIIARVFMEYPQQTLWQLAAVVKSQVAQRKAAAMTVLRTAERKAKSTETKELVAGFSGLCDQLYKLCHHMPKDTSVKFTHFSIKREFSALQRMMPMRIMVPMQATLTPMLPPSPLKDSEHSPFSHNVEIQGIADNVDVMNSLQKPKKIKFLGSDGREYLFLAKPKDDLRKDARMMEMMGVLNRLLARHPASRRRNLAIRRFAVTPLTEDCGILEWVPRTGTLRSAVQGIYQQEGHFDPRRTNSVIDAMYKQHEHKYQDKRRTELLDKVLATLPPRLHRWFLARWAEPAAWHAARLAFTRTAAVMSMVGHICGLGDRHGENILVHSETGGVMHVDFGCLFDQGLTLAKPEMVPFRLTQNIIDAFGVSGQEGVFRRCCEITLEVLRADRETLLSVLETFVHDPLVDWTKTAHRTAADADNPHARDALATIAGRLTGTVIGVSSMPSPPLSVEGHAHRLIDEAVCKERLGKMYIWWMAWM